MESNKSKHTETELRFVVTRDGVWRVKESGAGVKKYKLQTSSYKENRF